LLLFFFTAVTGASSQSGSAEALLGGDQLVLLDAAIAHYEEIEAAGGWPLLESAADKPILAAGSIHADVRIIRKRLDKTGDVRHEMGADPQFFDRNLAGSVMRFQRRHGLEPTGVVDHTTRYRLSLSVDELLEQLRHAHSQWAALRVVDSGRRVFVNIPEARAYAINGDDIELDMRVIVGHPNRPTPVLSSYINGIVVNPIWTIPRSIAVQDYLPRQQQDGSYFERNSIRVYSNRDDGAKEVSPQEIDWQLLSDRSFPYRLKQDAGPGNSLGRYKFEFPNAYDVYLHDTPGQPLLDLGYRTLSSGCVRLQEPAALAKWLAGSEQPSGRLREAEELAGYQSRKIRITEKIPVDLVYLSAWVSPADNSVRFRRDVYEASAAPAQMAGSTP
jgi:murein L,D-transpeptidase YcbB/YkuD